MTFDRTKPFTTRDGRPAIIYAVHERQYFAIHGAIFLADRQEWKMHEWRANGRWRARCGLSPRDLINIPEDGQ